MAVVGFRLEWPTSLFNLNIARIAFIFVVSVSWTNLHVNEFATSIPR